MPNCTPSWIASQSQNPRRRRTATPVVSLRKLGRDSLLKDCPPSLFLPNMGHTWTPNCPTYLLPIACDPCFHRARQSRRRAGNRSLYHCLSILARICLKAIPTPARQLPTTGYGPTTHRPTDPLITDFLQYRTSHKRAIEYERPPYPHLHLHPFIPIF